MARFLPHLSDFDRSWSDSGRIRPNFGHVSGELDRFEPITGKLGPESAKSGTKLGHQIRGMSAKFDQTRAKFGPDPTKVGGEFGRAWARSASARVFGQSWSGFDHAVQGFGQPVPDVWPKFACVRPNVARIRPRSRLDVRQVLADFGQHLRAVPAKHCSQFRLASASVFLGVRCLCRLHFFVGALFARANARERQRRGGSRHFVSN